MTIFKITVITVMCNKTPAQILQKTKENIV